MTTPALSARPDEMHRTASRLLRPALDFEPRRLPPGCCALPLLPAPVRAMLQRTVEAIHRVGGGWPTVYAAVVVIGRQSAEAMARQDVDAARFHAYDSAWRIATAALLELLDAPPDVAELPQAIAYLASASPQHLAAADAYIAAFGGLDQFAERASAALQ